MRRVFAVSVIALATVCIALSTQAMGEKLGGAKVASRQEARDFTLTSIDGKIIKLSDYKGKVLILDFWATWCPPCRAEIPDFVALQDQYGKKGLQIVGISVDQGGAAVVKPFAKENNINYPILLTDGKVEAAYGGIRGIPTTFVIDREGNIRNKYVGFTAKGVFEKDIVALLKEE